MKGNHKSTVPAGCAMKVDLMKAYDSVGGISLMLR
jgi:hypothetical protein